jgi:hypothetical protein
MSEQEQKQYAKRDPYELDMKGGYFIRHLSAMTAEGLHAKSDIAAELAFRDMENEQLRAENAELKKVQGEPVAWLVEDIICRKLSEAEHYAAHGELMGIRPKIFPLYTAPQPAAAIDEQKERAEFDKVIKKLFPLPVMAISTKYWELWQARAKLNAQPIDRQVNVAPAVPEGLREAVNALLHQIDIGDFFDSNGHSAKMLKPVHDLMAMLAAPEQPK